MILRSILLGLTLASGLAFGQVQTQVGVTPVQEVQRVAPQLLAFAGGEVNFANLVNGLALGLPVTLTTPLASGVTQIVTFTPTGTMSSLKVAQTLEAARQALITRGIATPTAQQIGVTLVGGALPTALGNVQTNALIRSNTTLATTTANPSAVAGGTRNLSDSRTNGNLSDSTRRGMSDSTLPRGIADSPPSLVNGVATTAPSTPFTGASTNASSPFISTTPSANPANRFGGSAGRR